MALRLAMCVNFQKQAIFTESYLLQHAATLQTLTNTSTRVSRVPRANIVPSFVSIMLSFVTSRVNEGIEVAGLIQELVICQISSPSSIK